MNSLSWRLRFVRIQKPQMIRNGHREIAIRRMKTGGSLLDEPTVSAPVDRCAHSWPPVGIEIGLPLK